MESNPHLTKAQLLLDQGRHELAEKEARLVLGESPENAAAYSILALALSGQKKFQEAQEAAEQAIAQDPGGPISHYVLACVMVDRRRYPDAEKAIREAISLDPFDADYHGLLAAICFDRSRWKEALAAAEKGLELNAEHALSANMRAMSLVKLGRRDEAAQTMGATLADNPEDSFSHSTMGWTRIEERNPDAALEHFREALRLDPENGSARQGIVEALKARNPIYGMILRYFLAMAKLPPGIQFAILFGAVFLMRALGRLKESHPEWAPWIFWVQVAYLGFVLITWTAIPLFNLLLRLNPVGRMALTEEQVKQSNWVGAVVGLGTLSLILHAVFGGPFLLGALMFFPLLFPLASSFNCAEGWPRRVMQAATIVFVLMALGAIGLMVAAAMQRSPALKEMGQGLFGIFFLGCLLSSWAGTMLASVTVRR